MALKNIVTSRYSIEYKKAPKSQISLHMYLHFVHNHTLIVPYGRKNSKPYLEYLSTPNIAIRVPTLYKFM